MEENALKTVVEAYVRAYNQFDIEGMLERLHEDILFENISYGIVTTSTKGIEAFKEQAETAKGFFKERKQTIVNLRISGEVAEADVTYSATLARDLPDGLDAGETINLSGKSVFKFRDDKIIHIQDIS